MKTLELNDSIDFIRSPQPDADTETYILTVGGKPRAALVMLDNLAADDASSEVSVPKRLLRVLLNSIPRGELENRLEDEVVDKDPQLLNLLKQRYASVKAGRGYTTEEMFSRLEMAPEEEPGE